MENPLKWMDPGFHLVCRLGQVEGSPPLSQPVKSKLERSARRSDWSLANNYHIGQIKYTYTKTSNGQAKLSVEGEDS